MPTTMTSTRCQPSVTESDPTKAASLSNVVKSFAAADHRLVLSDFDGTLADIVEAPDDATIRPESRAALAALADHEATDVAAVSGRALDDVADRVGLDELWYAGNHGLEIRIDGESFVHPTAEQQRDAIASACDRLRSMLDDVEGALVERKELTATIHYRMADEAGAERVRDAVRTTVADADGIDVHDGKQIFELRPAIEWDKGRAVEWILDRAYEDPDDVYPLYLGDDVSDEAAFEALADTGTGIRVGDDATTAADVTVTGPSAVTDFLGRVRDAMDGA